jgi:hypothetical protein
MRFGLNTGRQGAAKVFFSWRNAVSHPAHSHKEVKRSLMQSMRTDTTTIAMDPVCLIRAMQFIQKEMCADEVLFFAAHVRGCFECREYLRELGRLLNHRDRIAQRLEVGL